MKAGWPGPWPERWMTEFLNHFAITGNVTQSAIRVGIGRRTAYDWRDRHEGFAAAWAEADEEASDQIRAEIRRRAMDGWLEPVYYKGDEVGMVRKYSDRLLEAMAEARVPEYRKKREVAVTGADGKPLAVALYLPALDEDKPDDGDGGSGAPAAK